MAGLATSWPTSWPGLSRLVPATHALAAPTGLQRAYDLYDSSCQRRQLLRRYRECRREINNRAERPNEHPFLDEARAQPNEVVDAMELDDADRSLHADVFDVTHAAAGRKASLER